LPRSKLPPILWIIGLTYRMVVPKPIPKPPKKSKSLLSIVKQARNLKIYGKEGSLKGRFGLGPKARGQRPLFWKHPKGNA
jgi:hypothetical protein